MLVVALTGGIGCGKNIASNFFRQDFNVPIVDADNIARELSQTAYVVDLIQRKLGVKYIDENRMLLRHKLRQAIFSDSSIRHKLENILHPLIYDEIQRKLKLIDKKYCIVVIPLLLETKRTDFVGRILVVDCTVEEQVQRVISRDKCDAEQVNSIISAQMDRNERLKLADDIIENSGSIESLKEKVAILHKKYNNLN